MARETGKIRRWKRRNGKAVVCLEFWLDGERKRIYSDRDRWGRKHRLTDETARLLLDDIRAEIRQRRGTEEALAPFLSDQDPINLFSTRWDRYLEQKRREARAGQITTRHLNELESFKRRGYLGSLLECSIYEIDYGTLEDWLAWLEDERPHLSPKSRKHVLSAVMSCLRWLHLRGDLAKLPAAPSISVDEHAPVLLDNDTLSAILDAIPEPSRGIFLAMACMGLRPNEARALTGSAYRDGRLTVARAAKDQLTEGRIAGTKTRRVRRLPVDERVAAWIDKHVSPADLLADLPLFRNPNGRTESRRWSHAALTRAWTRAQLKAFGRTRAPLYEGTRHTFGTLALNRGAELYHVQRYLGHTDQRTTERYAKLADGGLVSVLKPSTDRLQP